MTKVAFKTLVADKITAALIASGLSRRKAENLAKELAPVARRAVKSEAVAKEKAKSRTSTPKSKLGKAVKENGEVEQKTPVVDDTKALSIYGKLRLRLDLAIMSCSRSDNEKPEVLRVVHGLTSTATYIVAAVRGDGMIAIRRWGNTSGYTHNVKFYPNMEFWGVDQRQLASLGAGNFLKREWYERMHFPENGVDQLLARFEAEAKSKSRVKNALDRIKAIAYPHISKAFEMLYTKQIAA